MNHLAHALLSGNNEELLIGNFIADFVKGNQYHGFPLGIQKGILLHRKIDYYTDNHPLTHKSTGLVNNQLHHYSGVAVDVYYDHLLARNFLKFSTIPLRNFCDRLYVILQENKKYLPGEAPRFLDYVIRNDRFFGYSDSENLEAVFKGISLRTSFASGLESAHLYLKAHDLTLEENFLMFFPQLVLYVDQQYEKR